jgi:hypothetical protein
MVEKHLTDVNGEPTIAQELATPNPHPPRRHTEMVWKTLDSGLREDYYTGARRDIREGKGRYDLLPTFAMRRVAGVYERGAGKYGDRNYEKGIPLSRFLDSALRHTFQVLEGRTDEDHAAQAAWNLLAFLQTQEMIERDILPPSLNDLPTYEQQDRGHDVPEQTSEPDYPDETATAAPAPAKRPYHRRKPTDPEPVRTIRRRGRQPHNE